MRITKNLSVPVLKDGVGNSFRVECSMSPGEVQLSGIFDGKVKVQTCIDNRHVDNWVDVPGGSITGTQPSFSNELITLPIDHIFVRLYCVTAVTNNDAAYPVQAKLCYVDLPYA